MSSFNRLLTLAVVATGLAGNLSAATPPPYASLATSWANDWNDGNLDAIMKLYALYPVFLPTSGERWEGPVAIRGNFAKAQAMVRPALRLHNAAMQSSGLLAYDSGTYEETVTPVKGGKPLAVKGSYLFVFERQPDGDWKILEQMWTESGPAKL
ncbi:MAG TPA: DUF4440 domain-containing protein [Rhizomicrobium sp.]|jgi:ketosteroid isomerase-like protein